MRFRSNLQYDYGLKPLHCVSYLTVALLLVLLFLFPGGWVSSAGLPVDVQPSFTAGQPSRELIIDNKGQLYLDAAPVRENTLAGLLKSGAKQGAGIMIKASKDIPLSKLVRIWELCRDSGMTDIRLLTDE